MSLRVSLASRLASPRFWLLVSALSLRAAGFVSGFVLVRSYGLAAMGAYSVVLNTAAMLTAPLGGCISNSSTVMGREYRDGASNQVCVVCVYLAIAAVGSVALLPALIVLARSSGAEPQSSWIFAVYFALLFGQLGLQAVQGTAAGLGAAGSAAKALAVLALVSVLAAWPIINGFGSGGALVLASTLAVAAPAFMLASSRQLFSGPWRWLEALRMLRFTFGSYPLVLASVVNSAASWASSIYLTQKLYGTAGVGSVALALQWLTVLLLPATSWGGLTLDVLNNAKGRSNTFLAVIRAQQRKNIGITMVGSCCMGLGAFPLAWVYGQAGTDLPMLFVIVSFAALTSAFNNVLERAFFALRMRLQWFLVICAGIAVQLAFVFSLGKIGVWAIPGGLVVGGLVVAVLGSLLIRVAMRTKND